MFLPKYYDERYLTKFAFSNYSKLWIVMSDGEVAWKVVLMLIVGLTAIIANSVIVFLIVKHKNLHKSTYMFIANLSLASVLLNLYSPWAYVTEHVRQFYLLGEIGCHLSSSYLIMFLLASGFSIIVISCDRMMIVLFPVYKTKLKLKLSICIIILTWVISITISGPIFVWKIYRVFHYSDILSLSCTNSPQVKANQYYFLIIGLMIYVPMVITAITYIVIICKLDDFRKKMKLEQAKSMHHRNKVMKMFFIIMMIYFWSGLPFNVLLLFQNRTFKIVEPKQQLPKFVNKYLSYFTHLLIYGHCAINPFIYGLNNENMRKAFRTSFPFFYKKSKVHPSTIKGTLKTALVHRDRDLSSKKHKRVTISLPDEQ